MYTKQEVKAWLNPYFRTPLSDLDLENHELTPYQVYKLIQEVFPNRIIEIRNNVEFICKDRIFEYSKDKLKISYII